MEAWVVDSLRTLAEFQSRALSVPVNQSKTSMAKAMKAMGSLKATLDTTPAPVADTEAIKFYMLNHAVALIYQKVGPDDQLGDFRPVVETYYREATQMAARMLCYLTFITTREARHVHSHSAGVNYKQMVNKFGPEATDFLTKKWPGEDGIAHALVKSPPHTTLGNYMLALADIFYTPKWSGAYGGPAWGNVTDCLSRYVFGAASAEATLDTAWTLAHNGGPIFNKPLLYSHYTKGLMRMLDIQACGQIPQWVNEAYEHEKTITPEVKELWGICEAVLPEFGDPVDWDLIHSKTGTTQKAQKMAKHGTVGIGNVQSPTSTYAVNPTTNQFQVDPHNTVPLSDDTVEAVDAELAEKMAKAMKAVKAKASKEKAAQAGTPEAFLKKSFKVSPSGKIKFINKK